MGSYDLDDNHLNEEDKEFQIAFNKGLIKPGVYRQFTAVENRCINNVKRLKGKVEEFKLNLSFDETLCLECEPAPVDPNLALQLEECKTSTMKKNEKEKEIIYNDFAREMLFYRLGQSAVLKGIPTLRGLAIPTKRPLDYFAEMTKSDDHMHKVRAKLQAKEKRILLSEKAKKLRELKKFGKKVQIQKQLDRQAEKKKILEQLKKYRKGKINSLDFLGEKAAHNVDDEGGNNTIIKSKATLKKELKTLTKSRKIKNRKFGLNTGKKKGWKKNTAKDLDGPVDSAGFVVSKAPRGRPQKRPRLNNKNENKAKEHKKWNKKNQIGRKNK